MIGWDLLSTLGGTFAGATVAMVGYVATQAIKNKGNLDVTRVTIDRDIRRNTEELATKLLEIADNRVSHFQSENLRLVTTVETLQREVYEARQAIALLRAVLFANPRQRAATERRAHAFLASLAE